MSYKKVVVEHDALVFHNMRDYNMKRVIFYCNRDIYISAGAWSVVRPGGFYYGRMYDIILT